MGCAAPRHATEAISRGRYMNFRGIYFVFSNKE